jgi:hypothetical protein
LGPRVKPGATGRRCAQAPGRARGDGEALCLGPGSPAFAGAGKPGATGRRAVGRDGGLRLVFVVRVRSGAGRSLGAMAGAGLGLLAR